MYIIMSLGSMLLILLGSWNRRNNLFVCARRLTSFTWPRSTCLIQLTGILLPFFMILSFLIDSTTGNLRFLRQTQAPTWQVWLYIYSVVNFGLMTIFPSITYLTFGLILRYQLAQNNNMLRKLLENVHRSWLPGEEAGIEEELFKVYNTYVSLRQLYKKLVYSQSLGLLGVQILHLTWLFMLISNALIENNLIETRNYSLSISILLLTLLQGHVADTIKDEVRSESPFFYFTYLTFCSFRTELHITMSLLSIHIVFNYAWI